VPEKVKRISQKNLCGKPTEECSYGICYARLYICKFYPSHKQEEKDRVKALAENNPEELKRFCARASVVSR